MTPEDWIAAVLKKSQGMSRPVYRGQEDAKWPLHSSAVRRLCNTHGKGTPKDKNTLWKMVDQYHKHHLIPPMDTIVGDTMSDLQRLSALQHHGAATGLLDFTESPLVALWFACAAAIDVDGKVFLTDIGDHSTAVNGRLLYDPFEPRSEVVYYEPDRALGPRIVAQQSVFVIYGPVVPEKHFIPVELPKEIKESAQDYLRELGISRNTLFPDIPGLATKNKVSTPWPTALLTPQQHKRSGNLHYQEARYEEALEHYKEYVKLCPDIAESHALLGDARAASGQYDEAVKEYTTAIGNIGQPIPPEKNVTLAASVGERMLHRIHFNRGNARAANREHSEAIADFKDALKLGDDLARDVLYNRGNSKFALGSFDEAWFDFDAAGKRREGSDACLAMGNCKVMGSKFNEAMRAYQDGSHRSPTGAATHCQKNARELGKIQEALAGQSFTSRHEEAGLIVETSGSEGTFSFKGNQGNTGNSPSGMVTAPGGEGYGGAPNFSVVLRRISQGQRH